MTTAAKQHLQKKAKLAAYKQTEKLTSTLLFSFIFEPRGSHKWEHHTSENIAVGMREAVAAWGLDNTRLVCITTDNDANMVKAAAQN